MSGTLIYPTALVARLRVREMDYYLSLETILVYPEIILIIVRDRSI
jgi:hypothetical protein